MENNFYNQKVRNKQREESNRRVKIMDNILKSFKEAYLLESTKDYIALGETPFITNSAFYDVTVYFRKTRQKIVSFRFDEDYNLHQIDGLVDGSHLRRLLNNLYDLKWQYNL